jgi:hypothetical protein
MKTKDQLLQAVNIIPEFEFKQVALAPIGSAEPKEYSPDAIGSNAESPWAQVDTKEARAITEVGSNHPLSFVSGRYQLIQFKTAFDSLISDHTDCEGNLYYNQGFAVLDVFPKGNDYSMPNEQSLGISAYNSVTKTSALIVRFSITDGTRIFTLPKNISSFYKAHVGKDLQQAQQEYIQMIGKIKDMWVTAVTNMTALEITSENFPDYAKHMTTDPRIIKAVKLEINAGTKYSLWSMAMRIYDEMAKRYAKSDIHRRKRIDSFIESIQMWGTLYALDK